MSTTTNLRAFTAPAEIECGEFKLRKFSAGTMALCRQVGISLIDGGNKDLSPAEVQQQLVAFLFIHTRPLEEVQAACEKTWEAFRAEHIKPFAFDVSIPSLLKVSDFIEKQLAGVEAASVDTKEKPPIPGSHPPEPPPNS